MSIVCQHCSHSFQPEHGAGGAGQTYCPSCGSQVQLGGMETVLMPSGSQHIDPSAFSTDSTVVMDGPPQPKVAHFQLLTPLGAGAFGVVWKAQDLKLDRTVALKIPHKHLLEGSAKERFLTEAKAAARLNHPGIVSVFEAGQEGDQAFLATELLEGMTLSDYLSQHKPSFIESAELVAKVADALEYAHSMGVIHRDVKPDNIFVDNELQPHVMDFGLAKSTSSAVHVTTDGSILGTPAYMAPEQAYGKAHQVDNRADLYSLGVVLFQLLTKELPYRGNFQSVLHQLMNNEPPSPRELEPRTPKDLESICLKCMQKNPRHRYDSCAELSAELKRFIRGEPVLTRPISRVAKAWRWCARHPAIASLSAAVCVLVLFVAITGPVVAVRQTILANAEREAKEDAQRLREEAQRLLYFSDMRVADQAWSNGNARKCKELLERHLPTDEHPDLRGFEWYYLWQLCHAASQTFEHGFQVNQILWSSDGTRVCSLARDRTWKLWSHEQSGPLLDRVLRDPDDRFPDVNQMAVSPDLNLVVFGRDDGAVEIWDVDASVKVAEHASQGSRVSCVTFAGNNERIAVGCDDGTVRVWSLARPKSQSLELSDFQQIACQRPATGLSFSRDGKVLAVSGDDGWVGVWQIGKSEFTTQLQAHDSKVHSVALSDDGTLLATAGLDTTAKVFDVATGKERATFTGHSSWVWGIDFSHDGRYLATGGADNSVIVWDVAEGRRWMTLSGHSGTVFAVRFSPDGQSLLSASVDGTVKLWSIQQPKPTSLPGHRQPVECLKFLDATTLASGSRDKTVRLWDVDTSQSVPLATFADWVLSIDCSDDGRLLAVGCGDGSVSVWDRHTHQKIWQAKHYDRKKVYAVALGPRNLVASAGADETIKLWDLASGRPVGTLRGHKDVIEDLGFTPGGKLLSASRDRSVRCWNCETLEMVDEFGGHGDWVLALDVLPDGKSFLSAGYDHVLRKWDLQTGASELMPGHSNWIWDLAISPNGQNVATASVDTTVKLWDLSDNTERFTLTGHSNGVLAVAYSPTGDVIASAGDSGVIQLWRASSRQPQAESK